MDLKSTQKYERLIKPHTKLKQLEAINFVIKQAFEV